MRRDLEGVPETTQSSVTAAAANVDRRILILSDDPSFSSGIRMEAEGRGFSTRIATDVVSAREGVHVERPSLAVINIPEVEEREQTLELIQEFTSAIPCIPVIALSAARDFQARLEASRRGADVFLEKPISARRTFAEVISAFERLSGPRATVLAVDDDPQILSGIRALLEPARMNVVTHEDALSLADALDDSHPDILLLDIDMPVVSRFEPCAQSTGPVLTRAWSSLIRRTAGRQTR